MAKECAILPFGIIKYQKPPIGEILMKSKAVKWLDIVIESINYIIVNYALSNMAMLFQSSLLFILFFASEVWVTTNYWSKANELCVCQRKSRAKGLEKVKHHQHKGI